MYNRILVYVEAGQSQLGELEGILDLADELQCRLIVLAVLPPQKDDAGKEEKEAREQLEDRTWNFLYQIEDRAFDREIKVSLMLEEGEVERVSASVTKSYEVDLYATFFYKSLNIRKLAKSLGKVPLLFFNQEGR